MSVRYEWFDAASIGVHYVPPMHDVEGGSPADQPTEYVAEYGAIVLSGDEATVLHGSPDDLRHLVQRILAALPEEA